MSTKKSNPQQQQQQHQSQPPAEVLPKSALVISEKGGLAEVLCKPKILPLKSVTLLKLEEMEARAAQLLAQQGRPQTGAV